MALNLGSKGLRSEINVTPLVDIMLVLLIIFMVVTPMLQRGKSVQLPAVPKPEKQSDAGTDVFVSIEFIKKVEKQVQGESVSSDIFNIYLGESLVDQDSLRTRLIDELRKNPEKEIYLKGDKRLNYATVRQVMEICHEAGYQQVKLATEEIETKGKV
jgi:biopolymer transport protein ExbD